MIDKIKQYKKAIIIIIASIGTIIGILTQTATDIEKEVVKIDSVITTVKDTTK